MERLINELHFINSSKAVDTIEVDIDSLPKGYYDYIDIVTETLRPRGEFITCRCKNKHTSSTLG